MTGTPPRPGDFPVALSSAGIGLFWIIEAGGRVTYSTAGEVDGVTVFGRGVRMGVRVANGADEPVTLRALRIRAKWYPEYPPTLRYHKVALPVPAPPLPFDDGQPNVLLTEDVTDGVVTVRGTRCVLAPAGEADASRVIDATIEAAVSGLWGCHIEAEYTHAAAARVTSVPVGCLVLLRGK
ncbi:MAG: hypothetical protein ACLPKE_03085 [Streptosporangiaceae bacterium]